MICKKIGVFICVLLSASSLFGVFYNIEEWSNGKNRLYFFSDYHGSANHETNQRLELLKAAKQIGAFVIVEDMLNPFKLIDLDKKTFLNRRKCEDGDKQIELKIAKKLQPLFDSIYDDLIIDDDKFTPNLNFNPNADYSSLLPIEYLEKENDDTSSGPLVFLSQFCKKLEIPVKNIEYRFFHCLQVTPLGSVILFLEQGINDLENYNDCKILNAYYASIYKTPFYQEVISALKEIHTQNPKLSYGEFLEKNEIYNTIFDNIWSQRFEYAAHSRVLCETLVKKNSFRWKKDQLVKVSTEFVINAKIMHAIYSNQYENIFICCGGLHINGIKTLLQKLGFSRIRKTGKKTSEMIISPDWAVYIANYFKFFHNIDLK